MQLTARQNEILWFIRDWMHDHGGHSPSIRRIGAEFGIVSPNGVMCHIKALKAKGLVDTDGRRGVRALDTAREIEALPKLMNLARAVIAYGLPDEFADLTIMAEHAISATNTGFIPPSTEG